MKLENKAEVEFLDFIDKILDNEAPKIDKKLSLKERAIQAFNNPSNFDKVYAQELQEAAKK
jgi:hypothetical protein